MDDSGIAVAQVELETRGSFQDEIHAAKNPNETVRSKFSYPYKKTAWSSNVLEELTAKDEGRGETVIFNVNPKFHFLLRVYLEQEVGDIRVSEKYQENIKISLTHNIGHNIVKEGVMDIDGDKIQSLDTRWMDFKSQFFMDPGAGKRECYNKNIGNVDHLTSWSTYIPKDTVMIQQPYYFSKSTFKALPLLMGSVNNVSFRYKLRRKLSQLVRMIRYNKKLDKWIPIKYNSRYLDISDKDPELTQPRMFGRYAQVTDAEKNWRLSEEFTESNQSQHKVYGEDIIRVSQNNTSKLGTSVPITLYSAHPVKAVFWLAENIKATGLNNRSNYTTNAMNLFEGHNPIEEVGISYGGMEKFSKMNFKHFSEMEPMSEFPSCPNEPGYAGYAYGYDITSLHADPGKIFNNIGRGGADFVATLNDTNPYAKTSEDISESESDEEDVSTVAKHGKKKTTDDTEYKIHVYMLVETELTYPPTGKISVNRGIVPNASSTL